MKHIQIILHEACNNHCAFCYYKNKSKAKVPKLNLEDFKEYDIVNFIGGELCADYYEGYYNELLDTISLFRGNKHIIISTNLLNYDFLYRLLKDLKYDNLSIGTSFDYQGRFTRFKKLLFWNNIERLRNDFNYDINCNLIMTKNLLENFNRNDFILFNNLFFMPLEPNENGIDYFYQKEQITMPAAIQFLKDNGYDEKKYIECDCDAYWQNGNRLDRHKNTCGHFKHLNINGECLLCKLKES